MYLNKATIIGNLTRDPEMKAMPSGAKVTNFSVATTRTFKDKDGKKQESTEFHNVVAFAKLAELCAQYLKKGSQALVEGRLQTRSWDHTDGSKKYRTEIVADNVQFGFRQGDGAAKTTTSGSASTKAKTGPEDAGKAGEAIEYPQEDINPDDIPF